MKTIIIFTDGSSRGNPGPGGWGAVIVGDEKVFEIGGFEKNTTNNKMELTAVIKSLVNVKQSFGINKDYVIKIHTDSMYVINGSSKWIVGWKNNGWKTKTKDDVLNKDLWMQIDVLIKDQNISWVYVGGHIGIAGNERCDVIATEYADSLQPVLYSGSLSGYSLSNITDVSHNLEQKQVKKKKSSHSSSKAYSYISSVGKVVKIHNSWADCETRVKGVKKARYKKSLSAENEKEIIKEFSQ